MEKTAYIFPGQGSQSVGMGKDLFQKYESVRNIFQLADEVLGYSLSDLCFNGSEGKLKQTMYAQPALLVMSIACLEAIKEEQKISAKKILPEADFVAGHSLGEYTALAAAGAISYREVIWLASERGRMMNEAGEQAPGTMAAIIGMGADDVRKICQETGIWVANYNCPGQIIISGEKDKVKTAKQAAKQAGAKMVLPLQVSGAFHCPLMGPAADELGQAIEKMNWKAPEITVIGNTNAQEIHTISDIKQELNEQLCNSVQWENTLRYLEKQGVTTFVEIGAGTVLTGLVKRTCPSARTIQIGSVEEIESLMLQ